jgi:hypothetical protein
MPETTAGNRPERYMKNYVRKIGVALMLPAAMCLGGCQLFGAAAGLLNYLIPAAASVGGAALIYYLNKKDD